MNIERWMHKHPTITAVYLTGYVVYLLFSFLYGVRVQIQTHNAPPKIFNGILAECVAIVQNVTVGFFYWPFIAVAVIKQRAFKKSGWW
jgi:hypothetical protein